MCACFSAGVRSQSRASYSSSAGVTTTEPTSQTSQPSLRQPLFPSSTLTDAQRRDATRAISNEDLESLQGDGVKLSLLVKAKAIEDQTSAFQILLDENQLTVDDQSKALDNIKSNYESLQRDYRTAKDEHDFKRRQSSGHDTGSDVAFDDDREIEGELYKLNMSLDHLEHAVQENLKHKMVRCATCRL